MVFKTVGLLTSVHRSADVMCELMGVIIKTLTCTSDFIPYTHNFSLILTCNTKERPHTNLFMCPAAGYTSFMYVDLKLKETFQR